MSPLRAPETKVEPVEVPGAAPIDTSVGWFELLRAWIKTNLSNDILTYLKGDTMNSKLWYASKTLWTNVITLLWTFVGPKIGIPTLDPDLMLGLLAVVNGILRVVTKQPVSLQ